MQTKVREYLHRCRQDINKLINLFDEILPTLEYKSKLIYENKFEEIRILKSTLRRDRKHSNGDNQHDHHDKHKTSNSNFDMFADHESMTSAAFIRLQQQTNQQNRKNTKNISKQDKFKEITEYMNKNKFKNYVENNHEEHLAIIGKRMVEGHTNIKIDRFAKYVTLQHFISVERRKHTKTQEHLLLYNHKTGNINY